MNEAAPERAGFLAPLVARLRGASAPPPARPAGPYAVCALFCKGCPAPAYAWNEAKCYRCGAPLDVIEGEWRDFPAIRVLRSDVETTPWRGPPPPRDIFGGPS